MYNFYEFCTIKIPMGFQLILRLPWKHPVQNQSIKSCQAAEGDYVSGCGRFIVGKEEIPTHSCLAEHAYTQQGSERDAQPLDERPEHTPASRGSCIRAFTRKLLDSM